MTTPEALQSPQTDAPRPKDRPDAPDATAGPESLPAGDSADAQTANDDKLLTHITIRGEVLRRTDLTPAAKLVFGVIITRMGLNAQSWPSCRRIAKDLKLDKSTVIEAVERLKDAGVITIESGGRGRSNTYREGIRENQPVGKSDQSENPTTGVRKNQPAVYGKSVRNKDSLNESSLNEDSHGPQSQADEVPVNLFPDDKPTKSKKKAGSKVPREPDPIWGAVCAAFNLRPVTDDDNRRVGKIVENLWAKGTDPDEIRKRIERYKQAWPNMECTPGALVKHWDRFAQDGPQQDRPGRVAAPAGKYSNIGIRIGSGQMQQRSASPASGQPASV